MSKLISTFKIGFDDETKAEIALLKDAVEALSRCLNVGNALPNGGVLTAMAVDATNDVDEPEPELKQLGQWVFEGQDEKWVSAHVDSDGSAYYCSLKRAELTPKGKYWGRDCGAVGNYTKFIGKYFDASNWRDSAIDRETINDVDYLSENLPEIDEIAVGELQRQFLFRPGCLSAVVPQITEADMQLIFIKNLSECLIQRMHSMDRFSEDDYAIGGNDLKAWDIVVDCDGLFGFALCDLVHHESNLLNRVRILRLKKFQDTTFTHAAIINGWRMADINWHTITEEQLPAFRAALEACYV